MQKAIVFGGSGFLGSHVSDALSDAGYEVAIFDLNVSPYLSAAQEMIVGDILDRDAVRQAIHGCQYVYNFAGIADLDDASTRPVDTVLKNIYGNTIILDACRECAPERYIYASTIYVHSEKGGFYRCSKQASELYIEEYRRRFGLDFTILRYGTLYGPRADRRNSIYRYLKQALTEKSLCVDAHGDELREYIHVRDAARLSVEVLDEQYVDSHVTITGHQAIRFYDLLATIQEMLGGNVKIELGESPQNGNHYARTPYSFAPKNGCKLTSNYYTDIGQGLLECLAELHHELLGEKDLAGK